MRHYSAKTGVNCTKLEEGVDVCNVADTQEKSVHIKIVHGKRQKVKKNPNIRTCLGSAKKITTADIFVV